MTCLQSRRHLRKKRPHTFLRKVSFGATATLDHGAQVAALTQLHHNVKNTIFRIDIALFVTYYVVVLKCSQNVDFRYDMLSIALIHAFKIELLASKQHAVRLAANFAYQTKCAISDHI